MSACLFFNFESAFFMSADFSEDDDDEKPRCRLHECHSGKILMHDDSLAMAYESIQSWKMTGVGGGGGCVYSFTSGKFKRKKYCTNIGGAHYSTA